VSLPPTTADSWMVPELGPSLGRLGEPPGTSTDRGALDVPLDDIRLNLVTGLFDVAGAARSFAAAGDREGAIASLGRVAWLELWERTVTAAANRLADVVNARLQEAAAVARLPRRRLSAILLSPEDVRAIASRLGSGGATLVSALDALEQTVPAAAASGQRGRLGQEEWQRALATTARRLESSWLALAASARSEQERWKAEIGRVQTWKRPTWPVWLVTFIISAVMTYLGLVFGGYLPVPQVLQAAAEIWWSHS
jgi:hypothetical protein